MTVIIPVLNEEAHLRDCLVTLRDQTWPPDEILVIDGGSNDGTRDIAARHDVRVLDNPRRIQAAAMNVGLAAATGSIIVRADGHVRLARDYVQRCVEALDDPGVVMVGGAMRPVGRGWRQRAIAAAMSSRFGAGPARFHVGGQPGDVDTVYLGAYRRGDARAVGGYRDWLVTNEDAEFAHRMHKRGRVRFDPRIRSEYEPRRRFSDVGRQFFRYGRGRATTARLDPRSVSPRQLAPPMLLLAALSPWRTRVAVMYGIGIGGLAAGRALRSPLDGLAFAVALPVMHLSWGAGFMLGLVRPYRRGSVERAAPGAAQSR